MTTDYEVEKQALTASPINADETESETAPSTQTEETDAAEELYFWSEPGVCG